MTSAPLALTANRSGGLLAAAGGAGALVGLLRGLSYLGDGFPLLLLDEARRSMLWALGGGLVFLLLLALGGKVLERWASASWALPLAGAGAALPLLAYAGLEANRAWGVRPSEILTAYALKRNLALVVVVALIVAGVVWVVRRELDEEGGRSGVFAGLVVALLALGLQSGLAFGFKRPAPSRPAPPMLVLLVDALRADRLSAYGNSRATSPAIDSLAKDGVLFEQAVAASTFTKSSVASLFTGRYPFQHGLYWGNHVDAGGQVRSDVLAEEETTLAEVLKRQGYLTQSWVQNSHLKGLFGFDQGFVDYRDSQGLAPRITRQLVRWLEGPGRRYGFFGYVHYIDVHDPYLPRPPYDSLFGVVPDPYAGIDLTQWGAYLDAVRKGEVHPTPEQVEGILKLYDGQVRFVDDSIGELLATLKRLGLYDSMVIVLLSDHGDGFLEHGFLSHSTTPYDELVRVPLIVKFPGNEHAGRVIEEQVRLVDLMPTLMEVARVRQPLDLAGCSLMPLFDPTSRSPRGEECRNAVLEIAEEGAAPVVAVRDGHFKYIWHEKKRHELYDLSADPREKVNLIDAMPPAAAALRRRAELAVAARTLLTEGEKVELDPKMIRELKALGYLK